MSGRTSKQRQQGTTTVEVAFIVCLVLLPLIFGIIDCSRYLRMASTVTRATREGAVWMARGVEPLPVVQSYLDSAGMDPNRVSLTWTAGPEYPEPGSEVTVEVSYDFSGLTLIPWEEILTGAYETSMVVRHE